jgi:hypothetical protein
MEHNNTYLPIDFIERSSDNVSHRKFKHVKAYGGNNRRMYTFCIECNTYLDSSHNSDKNDKVAWCTNFIWEVLSNEDIHQQYGDEIWRFLPTE